MPSIGWELRERWRRSEAMTRHAALVALVLALIAACTTPGPSPTTSLQPSLSATPATGFYLRAWYTQALPPRHTFNWLAMATIADGVFLDGNVAIDMIFPGPLTILPTARPITDDGIAAIVAEAQRLGLLTDKTDYTGDGAMPGARLAHTQLIVDGVTYNLTGNPDLAIVCVRAPCEAPAGTPEAFGAFWQELAIAATWLGSDLGPVQQFVPDRVALLLTAPTDQGMPNQPVEWPFDTALADAGVAFPGEEGARCVTLSGDALAQVWPALRDGNQLTVFVDAAGTVAAPVVRVLVPGDESPCPDAG
jgi:hypothetical protein